MSDDKLAVGEVVGVAKQAGGTLGALLERMKPSLAAIMPRHLTPERLIKVALNCVAKTPKLQACTSASLLQSIGVAAELGLEPGGALGHMYLVPYGNACTPIIGYRGLLELMRRSGQLAQVEAHVVHAGDEFKLEFGLVPVLRHVPRLLGEPGEPVAVYVVARLKDGGVHVEVMTVAEVTAVQSRSRSGTSGPWKTDWSEMAKKTVVRRAAKYLPISSEVARAFEVEDDDVVDAIATEVAESVTERKEEKRGAKRAQAALSAAAEQRTPRIVDVAPDETEQEAIKRAEAEAAERDGQ
jgi:recombination protein RecT